MARARSLGREHNVVRLKPMLVTPAETKAPGGLLLMMVKMESEPAVLCPT